MDFWCWVIIELPNPSSCEISGYELTSGIYAPYYVCLSELRAMILFKAILYFQNLKVWFTSYRSLHSQVGFWAWPMFLMEAFSAQMQLPW